LLLLQNLWMASMILLQTSLKIAFTFGICHHHLAFYLGKRGGEGCHCFFFTASLLGVTLALKQLTFYFYVYFEGSPLAEEP
jgi:hypothetical protein